MISEYLSVREALMQGATKINGHGYLEGRSAQWQDGSMLNLSYQGKLADLRVLNVHYRTKELRSRSETGFALGWTRVAITPSDENPYGIEITDDAITLIKRGKDEYGYKIDFFYRVDLKKHEARISLDGRNYYSRKVPYDEWEDIILGSRYNLLPVQVADVIQGKRDTISVV